MTARAAVLDASAVVALVLKQHGWGVVRTIVQSGAAVTTSTGLAEALITCRRKGYRGTREELVADLLELGLRIEPVIGQPSAATKDLVARVVGTRMGWGQVGMAMGPAEGLAPRTRGGEKAQPGAGKGGAIPSASMVAYGD
ncbi:MAG: hypothetical protein ACYCSX_11955 [Acidimicrobiales bacterium]